MRLGQCPQRFHTERNDLSSRKPMWTLDGRKLFTNTFSYDLFTEGTRVADSV